MTPIRAVFENGVFRPTEPVDLPEHTVVELVAQPVEHESTRDRPAKRAIYEVLSRRFDGDDPEVSARHNEHQP